MSFAGHQSFHIRDGWLRKGMRVIQDDPSAFTRSNAADVLGLGSVMVDALRFWLEATGLAYPTLENRWRALRLTRFGELVRDHDEYLEDETTLWLLHYHLVRDRDRATTWHWFFNCFARPIFTKAQAVNALEGWAITHGEKRPATKTLERDIEVLLHTYVPSGRNQTPEDTLDCPLTALDLIMHEPSAAYRLRRPEPDRISPPLALYVLLRYQEEMQLGDRRMALSTALTQPKSAGRVFALTATGLMDVLSRLREIDPALTVSMPQQATGLDELLLPDTRADEILERLYIPRETEVYA